jgi:DNA-binding response OmpR family regulator
LVVTDVQMPGALDAVAVGRHARRRHPVIPVIYATGRPESMAEAGPFGPREMMAAIRALLRERA